MTSDPGTAPHEHLVELKMATYIKRTRIALVLIGGLYAWTAYGSHDRLMGICSAFTFPAEWGEGSCLSLVFPPDDPIGALVDRYHVIIVLAGIAAAVNVVLAAIAGKKTRFAIYTAMSIFAVYTPLSLYQMTGLLSTWAWWVTAIVLGLGFQAASKANQLRKSRQLAEARLVTGLDSEPGDASIPT